jgi:hypothetical protein
MNPKETGFRAPNADNSLHPLNNVNFASSAVTREAITPWQAKLTSMPREFLETRASGLGTLTSTPDQNPFYTNQSSPTIRQHRSLALAVRQPPVLKAEFHACYLREGNRALLNSGKPPKNRRRVNKSEVRFTRPSATSLLAGHQSQPAHYDHETVTEFCCTLHVCVYHIGASKVLPDA